MKEEAKERSSHARFFSHSRLNHRFYSVQNLGTFIGVEVLRELS